MTRSLAVLALLLGLAGCKSDLYTGLTERDANEIISILHRNGVWAERRTEKSGVVTVSVQEKQFATAVETLKAKGYPKREYSNLGDVFQGNGFVVSQMEERARFIFAMSEELSRTISEIDGVLSARTHVVLPTSDPLSRSTTPSSASVFVRHSAVSEVETLASQIKQLVANSIEGLAYDKVSVVFVPVSEVAAAPPSDLDASAAFKGRFDTLPIVAISAAGAAMLGVLGATLFFRRTRPKVTALATIPADAPKVAQR